MSADNICADWPRSQLEQCVESIIDYRGKTPIKTTSGIPLITAKVIKKGRIDWGNVVEFISEDDYESWMNRGIPAPGAVVITTEAPLGEVAQLGTDKIALAQRVLTLCGKPGLLDNTFLRYVLQTVYVQGQLLARGSGTTVIGIKQSELRKVLLPVPSLSEQRAIAAILSALDDKIELNRQMNKTLEEMAQAIFKEWFVDFGPFRDGGMQDSELGPIPVGWSVYSLGQLVDTVSVTHKFDTDQIVFLNTSDILDGAVLHNNYSQVNTLPGQAKKSIKKFDILFSEIRPANKRFALIDFDVDNYVVSTKLMVLRAKTHVNPIVIYKYLTNPDILNWLQHLAESRSGTFPQITFDQIKALQIALPDRSLLEKYTQMAWAIHNMAVGNQKQQNTLAAIRDALLPKLMSGEIRVPVTEESA